MLVSEIGSVVNQFKQVSEQYNSLNITNIEQFLNLKQQNKDFNQYHQYVSQSYNEKKSATIRAYMSLKSQYVLKKLLKKTKNTQSISSKIKKIDFKIKIQRSALKQAFQFEETLLKLDKLQTNRTLLIHRIQNILIHICKQLSSINDKNQLFHSIDALIETLSTLRLTLKAQLLQSYQRSKQLIFNDPIPLVSLLEDLKRSYKIYSNSSKNLKYGLQIELLQKIVSSTSLKCKLEQEREEINQNVSSKSQIKKEEYQEVSQEAICPVKQEELAQMEQFYGHQCQFNYLLHLQQTMPIIRLAFLQLIVISYYPLAVAQRIPYMNQVPIHPLGWELFQNEIMENELGTDAQPKYN